MIKMGVWSVEKEEGVAVLTISKPPLNLVYTEDIIELGDKLNELRKNSETRAVVITGSGKSFIGGADITQFKKFDTHTAMFGMQLGQKILREIEEMEIPVIAAVNGYAFGGGCEVALACDIRICSENAKFGQLEINYGVVPGWGGTQRLTRIVGFGRAKEIILTGRVLDAEEALRIGLVSEVVPDGELLARSKEIAKILASKAPIAIAVAKQLLNASCESSIPLGGMLEAAQSSVTMSTEDCIEGIRAFMEKRKPEFKGR